jgi:tetratricopeptide (TPR) repeat protein
MARARRESAGAVAFQRAVSSFVGRDGELARVRELIDREIVFLVYGVAGVGKSELVFKIFEELASDEAWSGHARMHVEVPAGRGVADLVALIRAQLAGRGPARDVQVPAGSGDDRARLVALLDARPHLILVDDAHNLPGDELGELIDFIARHVQKSRFFVASRTKIAAPPSGMIPVEVRLGPLSEEDATLMITQLASRLGMEIDGAQIDEIARCAKGSPFFLRRYLVDADVPESGGHSSLDESLASLDRPTREILLLASALRSIDANKLQPEELITELSRRFLVDIKRGQAVVHDLVAESLARIASPDELVASQIAAADLLLGPGATPLEIVRAVDCLCEAGEYRRAWSVIADGFGAIAAAGLDFLLLDKLRVIAERADLGVGVQLLRCRILLRSWLVDEAAELAAALETDTGAAESYELWYLLGEIAQRSGDLGRSLECYERALELTDRPGEKVQTDLQIAWLAALYGEGEHARQLIENAGADPSRTAWLVAASHLLDDHYHQAARIATDARIALDGAGREDLQVRLAMLEVLSRVESYQVTEARAVLDQLIEPAARFGMIRDNTAALYRGAVLFGEGRIAEALVELETAWAHTQNHRDSLNSCIAGYFLAASLLAAGRSRDASQVAVRTDEAARLGQLDSLRSRGHLRRAEAALAAGALDEAEEASQAALELPKVSLWSRAHILAVRARLRAVEGNFEAATKAIAAARAAASASEQIAPAVRVELAAAEVALLSGQLELAARCAERARELLRTWTRPEGAASPGGSRQRSTRPEGAASPGGSRQRSTRLEDGGESTRPRVLAMAFALEAVARAGLGGEGDRVVAAECVNRGAEIAERGGFRDVKVLLTLASAVLDRLRGERDAARDRMRESLRELALETGLSRDLLLCALGNSNESAAGLETLIGNLGFGADVRYRLIDRHGRRPISDEDAEAERQRRDIWVDAESGVMVIDHGGHMIKGRPITCRLMAALIEAEGGVVAAESLYKQVWEAPEYHPLRHRNTLYVAINRLRKTLRELLPGRDTVETGSSGWRLADDLDACSVKRPGA